MTQQIRRIAVWSKWQRIAHWLLATSTLVLMGTGWLIANTPSVAESASGVHLYAASILIFALALRLALGFFGKGAERFVHLLPVESEWPGIRASLMFYLSFGKAPLPNWYAHNPLWKPLYLLLLLLLILAVASGWLMPDRPLLAGIYLPAMHGRLADLILITIVAHVYCVILQDWKGQAADSSAMLTGYRYFVVDRSAQQTVDVSPITINLNDIGGPGSEKRRD